MKKLSYVCLMICALGLVTVGGCSKTPTPAPSPKPILESAPAPAVPAEGVMVAKGGAVMAGSTTGGSSYRKVYENPFTTSGTYTWKGVATAPAVRAVEMTYPTGVTNANTFALSYTRNGITRDLLSVNGTMHTITWYVPGEFYAIEGDVWSWSNSAAGAATLTIYADYQY